MAQSFASTLFQALMSLTPHSVFPHHAFVLTSTLNVSSQVIFFIKYMQVVQIIKYNLFPLDMNMHIYACSNISILYSKRTYYNTILHLLNAGI